MNSTKGRTRAIRDAAAQVPSTWLDHRLTGPSEVMGKPPWGCPQVERLLNRIRADILALALVGSRKPTKAERAYGRTLAPRAKALKSRQAPSVQGGNEKV